MKKVKPGGEKLKGVIDVENCLYLVWSPHFKETYIGMLISVLQGVVSWDVVNRRSSEVEGTLAELLFEPYEP